MAQTLLKTLFWSIGLLAFATMIIVGVTDPAVFYEHFHSDAAFDPISFLSDLWPRSILIAGAAICVMLVLGSDRLHDYLGTLKIPGTAFMLLLFVACVIAMVSLIYTSQFSYPVTFEPETSLSTMLRIFAVMFIGGAGFPFLAFILNDSLSKPAPTALLVGLWLLLFVGFDIWQNLLFTGELDVFTTARRFLD